MTKREAGWRPYDPRCCHPGCRRAGSHGVDTYLLRGIEGRQFCAEHVPPAHRAAFGLPSKAAEAGEQAPARAAWLLRQIGGDDDVAAGARMLEETGIGLMRVQVEEAAGGYAWRPSERAAGDRRDGPSIILPVPTPGGGLEDLLALNEAAIMKGLGTLANWGILGGRETP